MLQRAGRPVYQWLAVVAGAAVTAAFARRAGCTDPVGAAGVRARPRRWARSWRRRSGAGRPTVEATANTLLGRDVRRLAPRLRASCCTELAARRRARAVPRRRDVGRRDRRRTSSGSTIGRHKLAPVVSPRKTVEGAVAQVVASVADRRWRCGAWLLPACGLPVAPAAGALLGVIGQVGDLAESAIKRSVGTKDTGGLIPGHGGVLDRIDSLLFNLPGASTTISLCAWCCA